MQRSHTGKAAVRLHSATALNGKGMQSIAASLSCQSQSRRRLATVRLPPPVPPPLHACTQVNEKKAFYDRGQQALRLVSGDTWYTQQAFRALNQVGGGWGRGVRGVLGAGWGEAGGVAAVGGRAARARCSTSLPPALPLIPCCVPRRRCCPGAGAGAMHPPPSRLGRDPHGGRPLQAAPQPEDAVAVVSGAASGRAGRGGRGEGRGARCWGRVRVVCLCRGCMRGAQHVCMRA